MSNWIEEIYRPWAETSGKEFDAPVPPMQAPNRWVSDVYAPWRKNHPTDHESPQIPWDETVSLRTNKPS